MKIDTVIYDGGEKGYQLSIKQTRDVVDLLENDSRFESFIEELRKEFNIFPNGYPFKPDQYQEEYAVDQLFEDDGALFFDKCIEFNEKIGFPYYWWSSIAYFALYNVFFTPERVPLHTYYESSDHRRRKGTHLVLKEKLSKNELKKYIDYSWDEIKEQMENLPDVVKGHNLSRISLAKEIYDLRKNKNMKYVEITDLLSQKYEMSDFIDIINEDYVKMLYHRWESAINKFKSRNT